jgi:hypothetical protein
MKHLRILLCGVLLLCGCSTLTNDAKSIVDEIAKLPLDSMTAKAGRGLIQGINDSLLPAANQARLDSLVRNLTRNAIMGIQDSLMNPVTRKRLDSAVTELLDTLSSPHNQHNINVLIANVGHQLDSVLHGLLGPNTGMLLQRLITQDILGDSTQIVLRHLRDTVLGSQLDSLVTRLVDTLTYGVNHQLTPAIDTALKQTGKTVESTSSWILWTLGIITALLMVLGTILFILKHRYQQMTEIMTQEIDKIPNQDAYNELVGRIHDKAVDRKIEPHLQKVLQEQGLFGKDKWQPRPRKPQS